VREADTHDRFVVVRAAGHFSVVWPGVVALVLGLVSVSACSSTDAAAEPSCTNGVQDGDEVGVDCEGSCATKCAGAPCVADDECASAKCENTKCTVPVGQTPDSPLATDGKKDNGETDVDCGGANAPKCADGKACGADGDCTTGYCPLDKKVCIAPTYDDAVKNGTETDVDCGGDAKSAGFKTCAEGKLCTVDTDCTGACNYEKKCVDVRSCKPHNGGDTCGAGELTKAGDKRESCCKTLPVTGYNDPKNAGKKVYLDKFEITAGRIRAFIEDITAKSGGKPNVKAWIAANTPPIWDPSWSTFLPSDTELDKIVVPHDPSNKSEAKPWNRNTGTNFQFNAQLFAYVHGHNCINSAGSYGFPTFWLPNDVMTKNGGLPRRDAIDGKGTVFLAKDYLDVKSAGCVTNAMFAAFCHWDGGQLATDEVLDFVTNAPANLGNGQGCGSRCAPLASVNATSDSGSGISPVYNFPYFADPQPTHEGTSRIAAPGRVVADVVRLAAADEPWMDLHGNMEEAVLDMNGAAFTGNFGLKYRGIGYSSARALTNPTTLKYPEYKAAYTGGRCMRFK
jgi:hypothetical protein